MALGPNGSDPSNPSFDFLKKNFRWPFPVDLHHVAETASGTVGPTIVEPSLDDCCVTGDAIVDRI